MEIEISYVLEEERKKCIEKMKNYYNKYGDQNLQKLVEYLQRHLEADTLDSDIKKQIEDDLKVLNSYL